MCNAGVQALMGSSHCLINRMKPISSKFHAGLDETRWRAVTEAAVKERLVGAQDEPEPIGPPSPTSGLYAVNRGTLRNSLQPVFDLKTVDPREFTFVAGHYSVA